MAVMAREGSPAASAWLPRRSRAAASGAESGGAASPSRSGAKPAVTEGVDAPGAAGTWELEGVDAAMEGWEVEGGDAAGAAGTWEDLVVAAMSSWEDVVVAATELVVQSHEREGAPVDWGSCRGHVHHERERHNVTPLCLARILRVGKHLRDAGETSAESAAL